MKNADTFYLTPMSEGAGPLGPLNYGPKPLKSTGRHGVFQALMTCDMRSEKGHGTWLFLKFDRAT